MKLDVHGRKARIAITTTAVAAVAVLIMGGILGIYYYTLPPVSGSNGLSVTSTTTSVSTVNIFTYTNSSGVFYFTNSTDVIAGDGYCVTNSLGQCVHPEGSWATFLGYLPAGYLPMPRLPNAFVYQCPEGMDAANCVQFQASCGDGVCNPNESCSSCPIDCTVPGQLTCNQYTGRMAGPESVCLANYCFNPNGVN